MEDYFVFPKPNIIQSVSAKHTIVHLFSLIHRYSSHFWVISPYVYLVLSGTEIQKLHRSHQILKEAVNEETHG